MSELETISTSACLLLLLLILAHISISSQDAVDTTKNRMLNLALRSGSAEFSMVCGVGSCPTANCSVQWFHVSVTSEEPKNIYNGYEITSGFALFHVNPDPWHLRSSRLRISDAGKYKCEVSYQKKRLEYFAELIVLALDPQCSVDQGRWNGTEIITASVDETIQMHCQVGYRGRWAPVFEWVGMDGTMVTNGSVSYEASRTEVRSNFSITVDTSHNGKIFECKITFTEQNATSPLHASNAPTYRFVWKSPKMNIMFSPRNIRVNHVKPIYHPGDSLTCEADGNPDPHFTWHNTETVPGGTGPEFVIEESMIRDKLHSLTCTASNSFGSANVTIQFAVQKGPQTFSSLYVFTSLSLAGSGVCIVIVSCVFYRKRKALSAVTRMEDKSSRSISLDKSIRSVSLSGALCSDKNDAVSDLRENGRATPQIYTHCRNDRNLDRLKEPPPLTFTVGTDGTIYSELNIPERKRVNSVQPPLPRRGLHRESQAIYASIDHLIKPPPPPLHKPRY